MLIPGPYDRFMIRGLSSLCLAASMTCLGICTGCSGSEREEAISPRTKKVEKVVEQAPLAQRDVL
jgi:hypothetical protein